jgi:hypothetical protein
MPVRADDRSYGVAQDRRQAARRDPRAVQGRQRHEVEDEED